MENAIRNNTGLIFKQLRKFGLAKDPEAESLGYEALYTAISTFDESKNIQFSTYATVCIYNALGSYVRQLNKQRQLEVVSYHNVAYSDDGEAHDFLDFIPVCVDIESDYIRQETGQVTMLVFYEVFDRLTNETHKRIITAWQESGFTASTVQIAEVAKVSQPYVSQVLCRFKANLKKELIEKL